MLLKCRLIQKSDLCADNIWNDQSLELDSDLPPGWRTIRDSTGTYYWHVPTGTTQWQHPSYSAEEEQNTINGITANQVKVRYSDHVCVSVFMWFCVCFCQLSHPNTLDFLRLQQMAGGNQEAD